MYGAFYARKSMANARKKAKLEARVEKNSESNSLFYNTMKGNNGDREAVMGLKQLRRSYRKEDSSEDDESEEESAWLLHPERTIGSRGSEQVEPVKEKSRKSEKSISVEPIKSANSLGLQKSVKLRGSSVLVSSELSIYDRTNEDKKEKQKQEEKKDKKGVLGLGRSGKLLGKENSLGSQPEASLHTSSSSSEDDESEEEGMWLLNPWNKIKPWRLDKAKYVKEKGRKSKKPELVELTESVDSLGLQESVESRGSSILERSCREALSYIDRQFFL